MPGNLTLAKLKEMPSPRVRSIRCLSAWSTCRGALSASASRRSSFVDSAQDETHACNYLLANDHGYGAGARLCESANWAQGYGDFVLKPDLTTLRVTPWLEGTALVLCDVLDHHHHEPYAGRAFAARAILQGL